MKNDKLLMAVCLGATLMLTTQCGAGSDGQDDDGPGGGITNPGGGGVDACPNLPPPVDACIPKCGNEKKIGQSCTKHGFQCPFPLVCTVDWNPTHLAFCTKPCSSEADCGSGMACKAERAGGTKGCVPASCSN